MATKTASKNLKSTSSAYLTRDTQTDLEHPSRSLRAYAVWEPILRSDEVRAARKATAILPDARVRHFWTAGQGVGETFQPPLSLKGTPAWDVYLVYPQGVEWKGKSPPRPAFFMHQLHQLPANRRLDVDTLAAHLQDLLVED